MLKSHPIFSLAPLTNSSKALKTVCDSRIGFVWQYWQWVNDFFGIFLRLSTEITFKSLIKFLKSLGTLSSERTTTRSYCEIFSSWSLEAQRQGLDCKLGRKFQRTAPSKILWSPVQMSSKWFEGKGNLGEHRWGSQPFHKAGDSDLGTEER